IVIFSRTLDDHLSHLYQLFSLLSQYNIVINPKKAYIGFPTIRLLGQKVSSLGLSTTQDKIEAIAKLDFPKNLKDLETYLGLTGWLRQYVPYYAYIAEPLQQRKTLLSRSAPPKGGPRTRYSKAATLH